MSRPSSLQSSPPGTYRSCLPQSRRCADSILLNGRGQVLCPPQSFLNSISPTLPITDKGCITLIFTGNPTEVDNIPTDLYEGCVNSTGVCVQLFILLAVSDFMVLMYLGIVSCIASDCFGGESCGWLGVNQHHLCGRINSPQGEFAVPIKLGQ